MLSMALSCDKVPTNIITINPADSNKTQDSTKNKEKTTSNKRRRNNQDVDKIELQQQSVKNEDPAKKNCPVDSRFQQSIRIQITLKDLCKYPSQKNQWDEYNNHKVKTNIYS